MGMRVRVRGGRSEKVESEINGECKCEALLQRIRELWRCKARHSAVAFVGRNRYDYESEI